MFPVGFPLAVDATRRTARSALPDAPTVDDTAEPVSARRWRIALATGLRGIATRASSAAERLEPAQQGCGSGPDLALPHR